MAASKANAAKTKSPRRGETFCENPMVPAPLMRCQSDSKAVPLYASIRKRRAEREPCGSLERPRERRSEDAILTMPALPPMPFAMQQDLPSPLLVFDLDGTLAETAGDLVATLNVILAREGLAGIDLADSAPDGRRRRADVDPARTFGAWHQGQRCPSRYHARRFFGLLRGAYRE